MQAINVRVNGMSKLLGMDDLHPLISWNVKDGRSQSAYRVVGKTKGEIVFDTGKVSGHEMQIRYDGKVKSRMQVCISVFVWDENDIESPESGKAKFEFSLLNQTDFKAKWINPELTGADTESRKNASYLKKEFYVPKEELLNDAVGRIYATAHGIYVIYLNRKRVKSCVLAPGTTEYESRLAYQTYDISSYLVEGDNTIEVVLGDGWYRGCNGNGGVRNVFGTDVALWLQMELNGKIVTLSDDTWKASQDGPIGFNDIQLGERVDARRVPSYHHGVKEVDFGTDNFFSTNTFPLMEKERFSAKLLSTPNGKQVLDFGQNMAGYISFSVNAKEGQKIKLTFGEYLDRDGNFSDENFHTIGRKEELHQVVEYICKEGRNNYQTSLSFFGFQMVEVESDIEIDGREFEAIAVYSDMEETAGFKCDNELLNKFFKNAIWSEKSNFVDIPMDCPQRERSGWTGDAGLFAETGIRLMNASGVYEKWLGECRVLQYEDGKIMNVAPRRQPAPSKMDELYDGASAWGDAVIIIPYRIHELYGNKKILKDNYEMMKKWMEYCITKAKKTRLRNRFKKNPYKKYMIDTGIQWGEWLEAGVSVSEAMKIIILKGIPEMTTPYFAQSARMLSEIAEILGKAADAEKYREIYENANAAYHYLELPDGRIHSNRQCRFVRPLYMGLLSEDEAKQAAEDLNQLVIDNNYHLNTGFLTTPYLCKVLADYGYIETAYRVLLQEDTPGWLFAVKNKATSVWESWEGYFGDVGFASLNHYSKGAVTGWMMNGILGICYSHDSIVVRPQACELLKYAKGYFDSPKGRIESGWHYMDDGSVHFRVILPANTKGVFVLPDGKEYVLSVGVNEFEWKAEIIK